MKTFLLLCCIAAASGVSLLSELDDLWEEFKTTFMKTYKDINEELLRREIWEQKLDRINKHNEEYEKGMHKYKLGLNEYSDVKHNDFVNRNGYVSRTSRNYTQPKFAHDWKAPNDSTANTTVDWRKKGVITPVKNQGQCGACWAFSSTGVLSAFYAIKTGKLESLSEQNLIDCSTPEGNDGCDGGSADDAFAYIISNKGLNSEKDYPYKMKEGKCHFNPSEVAANCTGYVNLPEGDVEALKTAVSYYGPITIGFNAGHESFQDYKSGIYDEPDCDPKKLDHAVLLVGYGNDDGEDYWLIKNSWGTSWGIEGYMKLIRNGNNTCGIATEANYPVI